MLQRLALLLSALMIHRTAGAQDDTPRYFAIGSPTLTELYVDPINGDDDASGRSPGDPLQTLDAAWRKIPMNTPLSTGFRINLAPGTYPESSLPNYLESRHGTLAAPIIIRSTGGVGATVLAGDLNVFDCRYLYIIGVTLRPQPAGDVFHCERCNHILLRGATFDGGNRIGQETIKINQSQYVFIENSNITGASDNAVDFVAVQYGHLIGNRISNAGDWCAYVKGGSAAIRVENNTFFNCGTGGFSAGQGTGFEFMESPWLHYEAYDIKFFNNIVHDTEGAAIGVNGGFNVVMAFNTFYRVGSRSHGIEVVFGLRSCDGDTARCAAHRALGGWGLSSGEEPIPNRNVFIYNNVLYNPTGFQSTFQHFAIQPPRTPTSGSNIPTPSRTDTNLQIRGNLISNGPADLLLGVEDTAACVDSNPTCNAVQLRGENALNTAIPHFNDPASGDFRPLAGGAIFEHAMVTVPNFTNTGRPESPPVPVGNLTNFFPEDRGGITRTTTSPPGAYAQADSPLVRPSDDGGIPETPNDSAPITPPAVAITGIRATASAGRSFRIRVSARCSDSDGAIAQVAATFTSRGSRVKRFILQRRAHSTYRGSIIIRTKARQGAVIVRATDTSALATSKRKTVRLPTR